MPLFRDGPPKAVADGDELVKIARLPAAVAPPGVEFLARLPDERRTAQFHLWTPRSRQTGAWIADYVRLRFRAVLLQ